MTGNVTFKSTKTQEGSKSWCHCSFIVNPFLGKEFTLFQGIIPRNLFKTSHVYEELKMGFICIPFPLSPCVLCIKFGIKNIKPSPSIEETTIRNTITFSISNWKGVFCYVHIVISYQLLNIWHDIKYWMFWYLPNTELKGLFSIRNW